ncbi:hypothetical protein [Kordiimonas laminariae]|uniref:hypothetical protein n=1 Tax=Kordiimonas laminariae TaxID=2917717 RepID=UPI001FF60B32|nr:hypothetical protein [Kordiimonas laminariae]MCK0069787.1 hypothetical protein [Kordiimonas laminariae]
MAITSPENRGDTSIFRYNTDNSIGFITDLSEIPNSLDDEPTAAEVVVVNGEQILLVSDRDERGVLSYRINNDGTLEVAGAVTDNGRTTARLGAGEAVTTAEVDGQTFAFSVRPFVNGVSSFLVNPDGSLSAADVQFNSGNAAEVVITDLTVAQTAGGSYVITTNQLEDTLSVYSVASNGALTQIDVVTASVSPSLDAPVVIETIYIGNTPYIYVASGFGDAIEVFSMSGTGRLTHLQSITKTADIALDQPLSLVPAILDGQQYIFVSSELSDGVSAFAVGSDGRLTHEESFFDDATIALDGVTAISVFGVGPNNEAILAAAGDNDNGISFFSLNATFSEPTASRFNGASNTDEITVFRGDGTDDLVNADGGIDRVIGGTGDDSLSGGYGDDFLSGGTGNDIVLGGEGFDQIFAGPGDTGDDIFIGGSGQDTVGGGAGNDFIVGDFFLSGSFGSLDVDGTSNANGFDHDDVLYGGAGNDVIIAGTFEDAGGNNRFDSIDEVGQGFSDNVAYAGSGNDTVVGEWTDILGGGAGSDLIYGLNGSDTIYGGRENGVEFVTNDTLIGGAGNDLIFAGESNDSVDGGADHDQLFGGSGNDTIDAGSGDDSIYGGAGNDILLGGQGADTFYFSNAHGNDEILDFSISDDTLFLANTVTDLSLIANVADFISNETRTDVTSGTDVNGVVIDTGGGEIFIRGLTLADFENSSVNIVLS